MCCLHFLGYAARINLHSTISIATNGFIEINHANNIFFCVLLSVQHLKQQLINCLHVVE